MAMDWICKDVASARGGRKEVSPPVREFHECFALTTSLHVQLSLGGVQLSLVGAQTAAK